MDKKEKLKTMFTSDEWGECKWSKIAKRKMAYITMLSMAFWNGVILCLKVFAPLVKVLRVVDGDKPSMGFIHGELKQAEKDIKEAFKNVVANYNPIIDIIEEKSVGRLDNPLHLAAYLLNPYYYFKDQGIGKDPIVINGIFICIEEHFFHGDFDIQNKVTNDELLVYKKKEGAFGRPLAMVGCAKNDDKYHPVGWWSNYGNHTPNLRRMASRILSLTTSSSGCERNWSAFEGMLHTKKRNRLDTARLEHLVYVQFNAKLIDKNRKEKEEEVDVLLASEVSKTQGWIVHGGHDEVDPGSGLTGGMVGESSRANNIRELHEEDFVSDEESEDERDEEYEFEFDGERVVERYGEEEL